MDFVGLAEKYVINKRFEKNLVKDPFVTEDIIKTILAVDKQYWSDLKEFSKNIKYSSFSDLCKQIFDYLLYEIRYNEDPFGDQYVRRPANLVKAKTGDCKSFSLFTGSILRCLGISYSYRFVSFRNVPKYTHVYVIAHGANQDIIIDAVYKKFNQEKPYTFKKDYKMSGIYKIEGIGSENENKPGANRVNRNRYFDVNRQTDVMIKPISVKKDYDTSIGFIGKYTPTHKPTMLSIPNVVETTDHDIEAAIIRQRLEIEKALIDKIHGVGSAKADEYNNSINMINAMIGAMEHGDIEEIDRITNYVSALSEISGKGKGKAFFKKIGQGIKKAAQKVGQGIKKAVKVLGKVVSAPGRLAIKGILEVSLPKAAPNFLYLFVNDQKILDKLPLAIRNKRAKQAKLADFIVNSVGMKREHFMGILRNGIMKRYGKSPENVIAELWKGKLSGIYGLGDSIGIIDDIIKAITEIIGWISKLFKKKPPKDIEKDVNEPDSMAPNGDTDASLVSQSGAGSEIIKEVQSQPDNVLLTQEGKTYAANGTIPATGGKKLFGIC